ncbi:hypothetical protein [Mucilaginibacter sp. UR6-11]|uniref:hypothetical protein n=1 Tax=Mucilaginibacter sp. UR6-11 TaxID=1435644 RepID=UPI001E567A74|nr:hypothetical protein [Mucilaginibacter sp. UR6-11]MCC8426803.1 hypothetical protein [Mucilaginibacter sp. UR6-11]
MKKGALLLFIFLFGCGHKDPATPVHISLTDSNHSLKITGINPVILNDINRDTVKNWQSLFAIYRLPADTDMKDYQPIQPGKYQLKDSAVVFTPDTSFAKPQTYFLRYYNYAGNKSIWDYISGKTTKGQLHYIDLIFKP